MRKKKYQEIKEELERPTESIKYKRSEGLILAVFDSEEEPKTSDKELGAEKKHNLFSNIFNNIQQVESKLLERILEEQLNQMEYIIEKKEHTSICQHSQLNQMIQQNNLFVEKLKYIVTT